MFCVVLSIVIGCLMTWPCLAVLSYMFAFLNNLFGDILAMKKSFICGALMLIYSASSYAVDWPSGYSKCADQGSTCKVGSSRSVSYGIKDKWVIKTFSGDILCDTSTFGSDPYPGLTKKCAVGPLSSTDPTPTPTPTPSADATKEAAPSTGWAGQGGGTT